MKRTFDLLFSLVGLALFFPLLLIVAVLVELDSQGPILFRQRRVGRNGRPFWILKFRTMISASKLPRPAITVGDDPRITRAGRLLRQTKIDELPQMLNVLKGDMTVVGPRPEAPEIVRGHYTPADLTTLHVSPGLTSPGTVYYYTHFESILATDGVVDQYVEQLLPAKLALDRVYLRRATIGYDFRIIGRTLAGIIARTLGRSFPDPPELQEVEANRETSAASGPS